MSTFRGVMPEFPDIRVDFFRTIPGRRPPLACFLSHVHSDHLAGLESLKCPFIYCSAATRHILLRLEKYPHRLNVRRGVLEARKVTYTHLKTLLKTIPLETPTRIEMEPGNAIQVTLFDANHCTGAVMFLIEGDNKAVLYTGDIRSEPWFVNNLTRNPFLIEYTSGLKTLDCIYLDTSNTTPIAFPTKADGIKELLQKVSKYPPDTVFHFTAWTFGYEEVWMALSQALKTQIHVDSYKLRLYQPPRPTNENPLPGPFPAHEGPTLTGYKCGNTLQVGCLTSDPNARIHSCEKGLHCQNLDDKVVWIRPIITRTKNGDIAEVGVGGGGGDLTRSPELEIDSDDVIDELLGLFANTEDLVMIDIKRMFRDSLRSGRNALSLDNMGLEREQDNLSLEELTKVLAKSVAEKRSPSLSESRSNQTQNQALPGVITFPYCRHSSYAELCHLVRVFNPKDIYPCTVDEANWNEGVSMETLFGHECSATRFRHDDEMRHLHAGLHMQLNSQQTHTTATTESSQMLPPSSLEKRFVTTPERNRLIIRRNSQGRLRPFDVAGNEIHIDPSGVPNVMDAISICTPPHDIIAISPGSESQGMRRKAILQGLREGPVKHARLQYGGNNSSPQRALNENLQSSPGRQVNLPAEFDESEASDNAHTPGSNAENDEIGELVLEPGESSRLSPILGPGGDEIESDGYPFIREFEESHPNDDDVFLDAEDNIIRCRLCGHEVWTVWMTYSGFCTGCTNGSIKDPYFEVIDSEAGPRPGIEGGDYASAIGREDREDIVGDYLDEEYDTQDEDEDFDESYEVDSFIDDESIKSSENGEGNDGSSSDGEKDYKELYRELQGQHQDLIIAYNNLEDDHDDVMKDLLGSDNEDDDDEVHEDCMLQVDVSVPDPVVTEVVLSQANDQSQESEVSADRIRNRVQAFQAAVDGVGWHNISMVSTRDNHTHEEIEL